MTAEKLAKHIAQLALEKRGKQIAILDLTELTTFADYFIIITGESDTQLKAIADHIENQLKDKKIKLYHKEGYHALRWVLLDYVEVIVHIFRNETRQYYSLERLWGDGKIEWILDDGNDR